jgi:hypothetical protein
MAAAGDLKSPARKSVSVRVRSLVPNFRMIMWWIIGFFIVMSVTLIWCFIKSISDITKQHERIRKEKITCRVESYLTRKEILELAEDFRVNVLMKEAMFSAMSLDMTSFKKGWLVAKLSKSIGVYNIDEILEYLEEIFDWKRFNNTEWSNHD